MASGGDRELGGRVEGEVGAGASRVAHHRLVFLGLQRAGGVDEPAARLAPCPRRPVRMRALARRARGQVGRAGAATSPRDGAGARRDSSTARRRGRRRTARRARGPAPPPGPLASSTMVMPSRAAASRTRPAGRRSRSRARTRPRFSISWARCVVFVPGAAHTSATVCPGCRLQQVRHQHRGLVLHGAGAFRERAPRRRVARRRGRPRGPRARAASGAGRRPPRRPGARRGRRATSRRVFVRTVRGGRSFRASMRARASSAPKRATQRLGQPGGERAADGQGLQRRRAGGAGSRSRTPRRAKERRTAFDESRHSRACRRRGSRRRRRRRRTGTRSRKTIW